MREFADNLRELLSRGQGHKTFDVSGDDVKQMNDYKVLVDELSSSWGMPVYSGLKNEVPITDYEFRVLHGDFGRAWRITWWEQDDVLMLAMLTDHDAATLTFLELEVISKRKLMRYKDA